MSEADGEVTRPCCPNAGRRDTKIEAMATTGPVRRSASARRLRRLRILIRAIERQVERLAVVATCPPSFSARRLLLAGSVSSYGEPVGQVLGVFFTR